MPMCVSTPVGNSLVVDQVYRSCLKSILECDTRANLIVLDLLNFDMILG